MLTREDARRQGPHPCELCGREAFSTLPGLRKLTYACCGCRNQYRRIFFELCAAQRPDLVQRSGSDIWFFDTCFDPETEDWADLAGNEAMRTLGRYRPQEGGDLSSEQAHGGQLRDELSVSTWMPVAQGG